VAHGVPEHRFARMQAPLAVQQIGTLRFDWKFRELAWSDGTTKNGLGIPEGTKPKRPHQDQLRSPRFPNRFEIRDAPVQSR
jgi:hypothetical protein